MVEKGWQHKTRRTERAVYQGLSANLSYVVVFIIVSNYNLIAGSYGEGF